jgi:nitrate reductase / nitrite oxidoreductase, alpha subunit
VRADWEEVNEIIAAANVYTAKQFGPDRIIGFSPIPAMSMVSYAAGTRYLSLIGGTCMSFYDWYCDLPPASPQTWGEQTDVPESADWFNSTFLMMWGSNVPQTRTPDAHYMTEARYRGTKTVTVTPDYSEASKFGDIWLNPSRAPTRRWPWPWATSSSRNGTSRARASTSTTTCAATPTCPVLVMLDEKKGGCRAGPLPARLGLRQPGPGQQPGMEDPGRDDENSGNRIVVPKGSIGFRWGEEDRRWNLEPRMPTGSEEIKLKLSRDRRQR